MTAHTRIEPAQAPAERLGAEMAWHATPAATAILASLTPAHVSIAARTPIIGPRFYEWSAGEIDEQLAELRRAHVAAAFGKAFTACATDDERHAYLAFDRHHDSVGEALRSVFGSPGRWGRPSELLIDCDKGAAVNAARRVA